MRRRAAAGTCREPPALGACGAVAVRLGLVVLLLMGAAAAISVPLLRLWPPTDDEGALLTGAAKLLRGGVFYRDVVAFATPGAWYLLAAAMRLGGESAMTGRALALVTFVVTVGLFYLIGSRVLAPGLAWAYGIALLALKFWAWPAWSAYAYADVAVALAGGGVLAFLVGWARQGAGHFVLAGALFAAAAMCRQTVGIYPAGAGLGLLAAAWVTQLWPRDSSRRGALLRLFDCPSRAVSLMGALAAGAFVVLAAAGLYFGCRGLFGPMLAGALPTRAYVQWSSISYLEMLDWRHFGALTERVMFSYQPAVLAVPLFGIGAAAATNKLLWSQVSEAYVRAMYLLIPLFFLAAAALVVRRAAPRDENRTPRPVGTQAVALVLNAGLFASAFPRADYQHIMGTAPAWLLVGFMAITSAGQISAAPCARRALLGGAALGAIAWFALGALAMAQLWRRCDHAVTLPRCGRVRAVWSQTEIASVVDYLRSHTAPGAPLFVLGLDAYCYFLAHRYSPWPYAQMYPGQTGPDQGQQLARLIEQHRIPYIVRGRLTRGGNPPIAAYAPDLVQYVARNYTEVEVPRPYQAQDLWLLRRRDRGSDTAPTRHSANRASP